MKASEKMIFVTVGTHEQPFNRLVKAIDDLKGSGAVQEDVFMQIGYCTYEPQYCRWSKLISYKEMQKSILEARVVITHGGPATFIMPLQIGKVPIVVPRQHSLGEHVNDHQVNFVKEVSERMRNIIPVFEISQISTVINNYEEIVSSMTREIKSNNEDFNLKLEKIVDLLLNKRG
jgi:UDP-N-acetylglucosamine transferase subunit ALG13